MLTLYITAATNQLLIKKTTFAAFSPRSTIIFFRIVSSLSHHFLIIFSIRSQLKHQTCQRTHLKELTRTHLNEFNEHFNENL